MVWGYGYFFKDIREVEALKMRVPSGQVEREKEQEDPSSVSLMSAEGIEFLIQPDQLAYWGESFAKADKQTKFSSALIGKIVAASRFVDPCQNGQDRMPLVYLEGKFKTVEEIWELLSFAEFYTIPTLKDFAKRMLRGETFLQNLNEAWIHGVWNKLTDASNGVAIKMALEILFHYHLSRGEMKRATKCLEGFFSRFYAEEFHDWLLSAPPRGQDLYFLTGTLLKLGKRGGIKTAKAGSAKNEGVRLSLEMLTSYTQSRRPDNIANIGYFASLFRVACHVSSFQEALPLFFQSTWRIDFISKSECLTATVCAKSTLKSNYFDTLYFLCYDSFKYGESIISSVIFQLALHSLLQKNQIDDALTLTKKYIDQVKWLEADRWPLHTNPTEAPCSKEAMKGIAAVLKMAILYECFSIKDAEEYPSKRLQYRDIQDLWAQYGHRDISIEPSYFLKNFPFHTNHNTAIEEFPYRLICDKRNIEGVLEEAWSREPVDYAVISLVQLLRKGKVPVAIDLFKKEILENLAKINKAKSLLAIQMGHFSALHIQNKSFHDLLTEILKRTYDCRDLGLLHLTLGIQLACHYLRVNNFNHLAFALKYVDDYVKSTKDLQTLFEQTPYLYTNFIALLKNLAMKKLTIAFYLADKVNTNWDGVEIRSAKEGSRVHVSALIPIRMVGHISANQLSQAFALLNRFGLPARLKILNDVHRLLDKSYLSNDAIYELLRQTVQEKWPRNKEKKLDDELWGKGSFFYSFYMESKKRFDWHMLEFLNLRVKLDKNTICQLAFRKAVREDKTIDFKLLFMEEIDCTIAFDLGYMLHCIPGKSFSFDAAASLADTFQDELLENHFLKGYLVGARTRGKLPKTFPAASDFFQALFFSLYTIPRDSEDVNWMEAMQ